MSQSRLMNRVGGWVVVLAATAAGFCPALAQQVIPAFKVLSCAEECKTFVPARPLSAAPTYYPEPMIRDDVEGLVDINYTITPEGHVSDAVVEKLMGPKVFADAALDFIRARSYAPATLNGKAVQQCNSRTRFIFSLKGEPKAGRPEIAEELNHARALAAEGNVAEAVPLYQEVLATERLNFFERTSAAYALAIMHVRLSDFDSALSEIDDATIDEGAHLSNTSRIDAIRLRIQLEARAGQFSEALAWFDILKGVTAVAPDDPLQQVVSKINAIMQGPGPFAVPATIVSDSWQHAPFHRTFTFQNIKGTLDHFTLHCDKQTIESAVSDKAQWTIPKSFSECRIYVFGAPKSSFVFVEEA